MALLDHGTTARPLRGRDADLRVLHERVRATAEIAAAMALGGELYHWFLRDRILNGGAQRPGLQLRGWLRARRG